MGIVRKCLPPTICLLTIGLSIFAVGENIKGKVQQSPGSSPIEGTTVTIEGRPEVKGITLQDGSYTLTNLTPGAYTVIAKHPRYFPSSQENVLAGHSANFSLIEKRYLRNEALTMVYADISVSAARVLLHAAKIAGDEQAEYALINRLRLEHPNDETLKADAEKAKNELNQHRAVISGAVIDASGTNVPNADIKLTNEITGEVISTKPNNRGEYEANVFPLGGYSIHATHKVSGAVGDETALVMPSSKITKTVHVF
jgi:hypothetical protein